MDTPDFPRLRVLCVDDNLDVADSTAALLEVLGYETEFCCDGLAALAVANWFRPDACLIDLNMPELDGYDLARTLRARADGRPLRLVAVTAQSGEEARRRARAAGFDFHLVKPASAEEFTAALAGAGGERFRAREMAQGRR